MKVKIYKPVKNPMQSGKANTKQWLVEYLPTDTRFIEPVMGWTGSTDTKPQLELKFETKEDAIAYAERNKLHYTVIEPKAATPKIQAYAENFMRKG
ncbi:MAG: complex subunit [Rickettsiaceae bacterium]|nr:complex subunit [Rickettsiaceae bacterium]